MLNLSWHVSFIRLVEESLLDLMSTITSKLFKIYKPKKMRFNFSFLYFLFFFTSLVVSLYIQGIFHLYIIITDIYMKVDPIWINYCQKNLTHPLSALCLFCKPSANFLSMQKSKALIFCSHCPNKKIWIDFAVLSINNYNVG